MVILLVIVAILFTVQVTSNIAAVMKEKYALKHNTIVIDKDFVSQEDLEKADQKSFSWHGLLLRAGDELKIYRNSKNLKGVLLGINSKHGKILLASDEDCIESIPFYEVLKIRRLSRYGKFFNF